MLGSGHETSQNDAPCVSLAALRRGPERTPLRNFRFLPTRVAHGVDCGRTLGVPYGQPRGQPGAIGIIVLPPPSAARNLKCPAGQNPFAATGLVVVGCPESRRDRWAFAPSSRLPRRLDARPSHHGLGNAGKVPVEGLVRVQQVVLRQEAGEEQPVPVLVGRGLRQVVDGLGAGVRVQTVAQGASAGAQPVAQQPLVHRHVPAVLMLVDGEVLPRGAGGGLGRLAGLQGDAGEEVALVFGEEVGMDSEGSVTLHRDLNGSAGALLTCQKGKLVGLAPLQGLDLEIPIRLSAGIPSPECSRRIMARLRARLRERTSYTR